ncbi:pilus assembly protein TadF [Photobacterium swingsii]|uniref:tight adherence pilus pseudopilin TadF n=1 Tax=Photobacterium swingsii TaxID=680026 RepID=UPI003D10C98A
MYREKGVFTIELAMILIFASSLFVMQVNSSIAIANKGKLQRVSYSLATLLSERKQLFNDEGNMCKDETSCTKAINMMLEIAKSSLSRMSGKFNSDKLGIQVEELRRENNKISYTKKNSGLIKDCNIIDVRNSGHLLPKTSNDRYLPLYQVSLCYETPFNVLGVVDNEIMHVVSSSISFARI